MLRTIRSLWSSTIGKVVLVTVCTLFCGAVAAGMYAVNQSAQKPASTAAETADSTSDDTADTPLGSGATPHSNPDTPVSSDAKPGTSAPNTGAKPNSGGGGSNTSGSSGSSGGTSGGSQGSGASSGNGGGTTNPPAFKANCITVPSSCGYPDATNTGVPAGTSLTNSGSMTITTNGAVVNARNVSGQIIVRANNVTIKNSRITSGDYYPIDYDGGYTGLLVEDTEIYGLNTSVTAGISFRDYTARRVYVHGTVDGLKADANVLIEDSYITDLRYDAVNDSHNDGIQTTGGSNVTIRHNTLKLGANPNVSAAIQIGTEWGGNSNWLVTNNLIDGGGWAINSGTVAASMRFTDNRFTRNAGYGVGHPTGATWTGNYYDNNGAIVP